MAGYRLGVDLGTTWTAAAVVVGDGPPTVVSLSQRSPAIPSVVHVAANGAVLVGEAAERRAFDDPERVAREMKRRIGDPTPVLLGGSPWAAELLQARVLRTVVDQVAAEHGGPPDSICVTHPANWGTFKLDLLAQAIRQVGVGAVELLPEPVAAATWYASGHRLDAGAAIAVYDLGGGTFDAAVVRRSASGGFEVLGRPDGVERFGGIDIDAAVLAHVAAELGDAWTGLDRSDPEALGDVAELRQRCVEAKEALSVDTAASIPVRLPGVRTTVRLTRDELEAMVRAPLAETIVALRRTVASAGLSPTDLTAVLLVGGSSRIPLVAHLVSSELGVPVAVDANPKYAVALGAALAPRPAAPAATAPAAPPAAPPVEPVWMPAPEPVPAGGGRGGPPRWLVPAGIVAVLVVIAGILLATRGGGDDGDAASSGGPNTTATGGEATGTTGSGGGGAGGEGDGTLRIGVMLPTSDDTLSFLEPAIGEAATLAVDDINGAGGVLGTDVELVTADSGDGSPGALGLAMDSFVDAGVDVVVGPVARESVRAVRDLVTEAGMAGCVAFDTYASSLDGDGGQWFRTIPSDALIAHAMRETMADDGVTHVAIVAPDDADQLSDDLAAELEDAGIAVDPPVRYPRGDLDGNVERVIGEVSDLDFDAVALVGDRDLAELVAQGEGAGLRGPFYADHNFEDDTLGSLLAGPVGNGTRVELVTIDLAPGNGQPGSVATRATDALAAQGTELFAFGVPYVYDCITLAATAAELAGSDDGVAIAATVVEASGGGRPCDTVGCLALAAEGDDVDFEGASSPIDFDDDGEVTIGSFVRARWTADGTIQYDAGFDVSF